MPKRTRSTQSSSQKTKRAKKSDVVNAIARLPRQGAFPAKMLVSMRYGDIVDLDPGAGGQATHSFSANGLFDPDQTGVGHQPRGFDQWMAAYQNYTVIGSKITVKFSSNASTSTIDSLLSVTCDSSTAPTGAIGMLEAATSKPSQSWDIFAPGNNEPVTLTQTFSHKKWFGKDYYEDEYAGSVVGNPSEQCFYNLSAQAMGAVDNPANINCAVQIDYVVMLFNPIGLPQS